MFLLNLFEDLKLDVQDAIIEHNLKKNIDNYNKAVLANNISKVSKMDLSDKIGETCRVINEIFASDEPHNVLEAYTSYLYLLLNDKEMHDFVQKLANAAITNPESCVALLNIFFDEEISEKICLLFYDEDFITRFDFIDSVQLINSCAESDQIDCTLSYEEEKKIDDQIEMKQEFEENNESPTEDPTEPEIVSETSTHEEIHSQPVKGEVIDNETVEEEPVKDVETKVVEETKSEELEATKNVELDNNNISESDAPKKVVHAETYGIIMDNINKDAVDMANKVLNKVAEDMASKPEPKITSRRNTTSKKKK